MPPVKLPREEFERRYRAHSFRETPRRLAGRLVGSRTDVAVETDQSMRPLEHDKHASWFRFVRPETRERCVAPTGKTYDFASLGFRCGCFGWLQHIKAAAIQEERVIAVNAAQLLLRRMIIWKHLSLKLAQSLLCLG
jgi:uncharacterized protein (DUF1810 family)